jgi:hypothetical protein
MKRTKFGGRQKNTPNRITSDLRHFLSQIVSEHLENDLMSLDPRKRAELLIRCLPYVIPPIKDQDEPESLEPLTLVLTRESCSRCDSKVV